MIPALVTCLASLLIVGDAPKPRLLFDGKTLAGWEKTRVYKPGEVVVKDGAIVLGKGNRMTAITSTLKDLPTSDYELIYEARRTEGNDFFAACTFPVGKSFLTFVNGGWGNSVTGLSSLNGSDASENETTKFIDYKNGTWYRFRIVVTNTHVRCYVDDKETCSIVHGELELSTRIEVRSCQPLGFASFESVGHIRNIVLKSGAR